MRFSYRVDYLNMIITVIFAVVKRKRSRTLSEKIEKWAVMVATTVKRSSVDDCAACNKTGA